MIEKLSVKIFYSVSNKNAAELSTLDSKLFVLPKEIGAQNGVLGPFKDLKVPINKAEAFKHEHKCSFPRFALYSELDAATT